MKATRYALLLLIGVGAALLFFLPRGTLAFEGAPQAFPAAESATLAPPWDRLLQASSLVVRGRVVTTASGWDATHTHIESRHVVAVHYGLVGDAPAQVEVQTTGGLLAEEGIGMLVTSLPTLTTGEEVLLFLYATPQGYAIAGNDLGKFAVEGDRLRNRAILYAAPLADAYQALAAIDAGVTIPEDWAAREALIQPEPVVGGLDFVYNNLKWATNQVDYLVNVNSQYAGGENGSEQAFLEAIDAAGAAWNEVGEADFTLVYAGASASTDIGLNSANEILFIDKGITDGNGVYMPLAVSRVYFFEADRRVIESDIWINDAYPWDVTSSPDGMEPDLQSVLTHEMGHWLVLGHDSDSRSIMFPTVTLGTLKRQLFDNDRRGISFIYPCPVGQQPCNPAPTATPTPTLTPTPTPTLTPTPSPTPSATPAPAHNTFVPNAGGLLTYTTSAGTHLSLTVPAQAFAVTTTLQIEHAAAARTAPSADLLEVDRFAITSTVTPGSGDPAPDALHFTVPFTLVMTYAQVAIDGLDEATLGFYTYDSTVDAWVAGGCGPPVRNATANRFESAICAPATYGLFATRLPSLYLPAVLRE